MVQAYHISWASILAGGDDGVMMTRTSSKCDYCGHSVPADWDRCPHCAQPGLYPNVRAAEAPEERAALQRSYEEARARASGRGCLSILDKFEVAASASGVTMNRSFEVTFALAQSDRNLYPSYYDRLTTELPEGSVWDVLRPVVETALFGNRAKQEVRFGALSLDGRGLAGYGPCTLVPRESMISYRTSLFVENSVVFFRRRSIAITDVASLPAGQRSTWTDRSKLCVVKLADAIQKNTSAIEFPSLLLKSGPTRVEDDFVEAHIYGPMTIRTFERVTMQRAGSHPAHARVKALKHHLAVHGASLDDLA